MEEKKTKMTARTMLIALAAENHDDWDGIYKAIKGKKMPDKETIRKVEETEADGEGRVRIVTIIDPDYPDCLRKAERPPFVLYVKEGDIGLLKRKHKVVLLGDLKPSCGESFRDCCFIESDGDGILVTAGGETAKVSDHLASKTALSWVDLAARILRGSEEFGVFVADSLATGGGEPERIAKKLTAAAVDGMGKVLLPPTLAPSWANATIKTGDATLMDEFEVDLRTAIAEAEGAGE